MAKRRKPTLHLSSAWYENAYASVMPAVNEHGKALAESVQAKVPDDVPVKAKPQINRDGRPTSVVGILHASGNARQAKHGVLTKSAAELGLEVTRYRE